MVRVERGFWSAGTRSGYLAKAGNPEFRSSAITAPQRNSARGQWVNATAADGHSVTSLCVIYGRADAILTSSPPHFNLKKLAAPARTTHLTEYLR